MSAEETTKNFWLVWNNFVWPDPQPVQYRLYYNHDGSPVVYTMEDLPGDWIEVSQQTYVTAPWNVRVTDGKLNVLPVIKTSQKLKPSDHGIACDPHDVCVVVEESVPNTCWSLRSHEIS